METDDRQTVSNGLPPTAAAVAETIGRDEASTPTLYTAAASEGDVPGAVATPPPAAPATSAAPADDAASAPSVSANTAAADPKAKGAATSSLSRVAQLTARVEKDPLDGEAQLALLQDAEQKGDLERTREVYERFLSVFPDAVSSRLRRRDCFLACVCWQQLSLSRVDVVANIADGMSRLCTRRPS
jgi:cleavage stimulation factor subunit 3